MYPERDCRACSELNKKNWGCEEDLPFPILLDGKEHFRCPRRPLFEDPALYNFIFSRYNGYSKGFLPEGGALADQPAKLLDMFRVIEVAHADCDKERRVQQKRADEINKQMQAVGTMGKR